MDSTQSTLTLIDVSLSGRVEGLVQAQPAAELVEHAVMIARPSAEV